MSQDRQWGTVVCMSKGEQRRIMDDQRRLVHDLLHARTMLRIAIGLALFFGTVAAGEGYLLGRVVKAVDEATLRTDTFRHEANTYRRDYERSTAALATLARTHEEVLDAKEQINTVGQESWARRFIITKYTPSAGGINAFGDGKYTSTLHKADPSKHIVAVDPALIPYGSWIWIEELGWYHAEDCGSMIKGFRLDVMNANLQEAFKYGKQRRFAIVVPPKRNHA